MKSFEYAAPASVKEATELLGSTWGETEILAGGTDLVTCLKQQITQPKRVVSLRNIKELNGIKVDGKIVRIGATTTLADLAANKTVQQQFPALVTAVTDIGSPQIISMGTAGGDLCQRPRCWYFRNGYGLLGRKDQISLPVKGDNRYHAIFGNEGPAYFVSASSLGPPLIALGAALTIAGSNGRTRKVDAADFFKTPRADNERETVLGPNEILTEIAIPMQDLKNATYEVRHRHGFDWPYVTATVAFQYRNGTTSGGRVVLGHVAPVPWTSRQASEALNGIKDIDLSSAARCGQAATQGAKPLSHNGYKVALVKTAVKRALLVAVGMLRPG